MRFLCALLFALSFFLVNTTVAQQKNYEPTMLWRISGKGLQKPSYVFGTMHLKDKRIFNFGDSVYNAIQQTEGFANEVDFNEIVAYYVNKMYDAYENDRSINEIMSDEEIKRNEEALYKRFKKSARSIRSRDIAKEKNKWLNESMQKGEMETFIDAYLLNLARRQGKWLGGIEDLGDQINTINKIDVKMILTEDNATTQEKMIKMYAEQDLNGILKFFDNVDSAYTDALLTRRNIKMARRMDSLSAQRTMFFAVGAGHLPGDSGVINLLRARGFTVEPVISKTKTPAEDYKYTALPIKWETAQQENNYYTVEMPGKPANVKFFGLIEIKFLIDFSNMSGFCSMATINSAAASNPDSAIKAIAKNVLGSKPGKAVKLERDGAYGLEYRQLKDNYHMRVQIFVKQKTMYVFMFYGMKKEVLTSEAAEHFFQSVKMTPPADNKLMSYDFTDSTGAYTLTSPAKLELNEKLTNQSASSEDWKVVFYVGQDVSTGAFIMVVNKQVKAGSYIISDTTMLNEVYKLAQSNYTEIEKKDIMIDDCKAIRFKGKNDEGNYVTMLSYVRNNRNVTVMLIANQNTILNPHINQVFTSLKLLPEKRMPKSMQFDPDKTFTAYGPQPFVIKEKEESDGQAILMSYDSVFAQTYYVTVDTFTKYKWIQNDSTYLHEQIKSYYKTDSIVWTKNTMNGKVKGIEALIKNSDGDSYHRMRILLSGNRQYDLICSGTKSSIINDETSRFFNDFRILKTSTFDLKANKTALLIKDLKSKDTSIREGAYNVIYSTKFSKADLPALHAALFDKYASPYNYGDSFTINRSLGTAITKLQDTSTVSFLKKQYQQNSHQKEYIIDLLSNIKTKESYNTMTDLLVQNPPANPLGYTAYTNLTDSLKLTYTVFPRLLTKLTDTNIGPVLAAVSQRMLDSNIIKMSKIMQMEEDLIKLSTALKPILTRDSFYNMGVYNIPELLDTINTHTSLKAIRIYLDVVEIYMVKKAALLLAKHDKYVSPDIWSRIAADPIYHNDLYTDLQDMKKSDLFPEAYLTQKHFAESDITAAISDDEYEYKAEFLQEMVASTIHGKMKFYLYKISSKNTEDTSTYLGIAGGFDTKNKKPTIQKDMTSVYWDEEYSVAKLEELFNAWLFTKDVPPPPPIKSE